MGKDMPIYESAEYVHFMEAKCLVKYQCDCGLSVECRFLINNEFGFVFHLSALVCQQQITVSNHIKTILRLYYFIKAFQSNALS